MITNLQMPDRLPVLNGITFAYEGTDLVNATNNYLILQQSEFLLMVKV